MEQTKRLYEGNSYIKECQASVISEQVSGHEGLNQVVLDQTIFYPTGGGQPNDFGWINGIKVVDVYKKDGLIYHVLESPLNLENNVNEVSLRIDWERRFDHMQQHSGQHLLSRVFEILFEAETVGFHLGDEVVTIDINIEQLNEEMVKQVEELANKVVMENKRISVKRINSEKVDPEMKRKIPEPTEYLRMVEIADFDNCACSGTHLDYTAEIGIIKIIDWEKYKQKMRLSFVCGKRALAIFAKYQNELYSTAATLKTNWENINQNVTRILLEKEELERDLKELKTIMIANEINNFKDTARFNGNFYYYEKIYKNREFNELKQLAQGITGQNHAVVLLATIVNDRVQLLLQRSDGLDISMVDCLKIGLDIIDGKGGGNLKTAQGGGENIEKIDEALKKMRQLILNNIE